MNAFISLFKMIVLFAASWIFLPIYFTLVLWPVYTTAFLLKLLIFGDADISGADINTSGLSLLTFLILILIWNASENGKKIMTYMPDKISAWMRKSSFVRKFNSWLGIY